MSPELLRLLAALGGLWLGAGVMTGVGIRPLLVSGIVATGLMAFRRALPVQIASLLVVAACLGAILGGLFDRPTPIDHMAASVPRCSLSATVLENAGKLGSLLAAEKLRCGDKSITDAGTVITDDPGVQPGGTLRGEGWLVPLGSSGFDGARRATGADASFDFEGEPATIPPRAPQQVLAAAIRRGMATSASHLAPDTGALLSGLTIGDVDAMAPDVTDDLRRAGLSHLVAVSGSNVAIVLGVVMGSVRGLAMRVRVVMGLAGLALYVLVTGPDASVLRAAAMGAVALVALLSSRRAQPLNAMALGLIAIIALRPGLATSVGLQLSAAATAGIVLFSPSVMRPMSGWPRSVALVAAATISAQIAVAPLLLGTFGQLSLVSPFANLLAEAAVAPATILGLTAGCIGAIHEGLGAVAAEAAAPFVAWILWVGRTFGSLPWAAIEVPHWTGAVTAVPVVGWAIWVLVGRG